MPLLSEPEYVETVGSPNSPVEVVFSTHSISGVSIIIQTLNNESLQDKKYKLEVSNNQSYGYVTLREITMGDSASYDTSFSLYNEAINGSILHFAWVKLSIPAIGENITVKVIVSRRWFVQVLFKKEKGIYSKSYGGVNPNILNVAIS